MEEDLVSCIIPSFNRFKYLLNAIESVRNQTYQNIEIIVINDGSSQQEYYDYDYSVFGDKFKIIHQEENSRKKMRIPSPGAHGRNIGLEHATGKYIAFLDDDDSWLPEKTEKQIQIMKEQNLRMSATQNYLGNKPYDPNKKYRLGNDEIYLGTIKGYFKKRNSDLFDDGMPDEITMGHQTIHNLLITSTIIMTRELIDEVGKFNVHKRNEDHEYWNRTLEIIPSIKYIKIPLAYYDNDHGDGRLY